MQKITAHPNQPGSLLQPQLFLPHTGHLLKTLRTAAVITGAILTSVVALQLVYPANRSLPRASFGGINLSYVSEEEIIKRLEDIDSKTFTAKIGRAHV